jgi:hypothetical protein
MIELRHDELIFSFPHLGREAACRIGFQRTLRIPDTDIVYPLPPGLGHFPLRHIDDLAGLAPEVTRRGGVALPIWQAEALWINFGHGDVPFAVKIAAGRINAVNGAAWSERDLPRDPQGYVVLPDQPWLDGFCVAEGEIRQFVAMRLGEGFTAEEQLTGEAEHGGLQIAVTPLTPAAFAAWQAEQARMRVHEDRVFCLAAPACGAPEMGMAAGGRMRQHIERDRRPATDWDLAATRRVWVALLDAARWAAHANEPPPTRPPGAAAYARAGLPWFDWYGADAGAVGGSAALAGLASVGALGGLSQPDSDLALPPPVVLSPRRPRLVRQPRD